MKKLLLKYFIFVFFCSSILLFSFSCAAQEKSLDAGSGSETAELDQQEIEGLLGTCGLQIKGPFHDEHGEGYLLRIVNYKAAEQCGLKFNPYSHRIECYAFNYSGGYILQLLEDDVFVDNWSLLPKYFRVAGPMYSPELMEPQAE